MKKAIELIEESLQSAIQHPAFMGFPCDGITEKDIETEGGDAAFVTADIAEYLTSSSISGRRH